MEHLPPAPIGERFSGERRVFGEYETVAVAVDDLIRLPQVRSGTNPDLPDLKESIKANGLLNPIDIAGMDDADGGKEHYRWAQGIWSVGP
jgi:hypothetical protein